MTGDDSKRSRLAACHGEVGWSDLGAHAARQALLLVSPPLSVMEAASAIAADEVAKVQTWLHNGLLSRPSTKEQQFWAASPGARFESTVVQPFVIARLLDESQ